MNSQLLATGSKKVTFFDVLFFENLRTVKHIVDMRIRDGCKIIQLKDQTEAVSDYLKQSFTIHVD